MAAPLPRSTSTQHMHTSSSGGGSSGLGPSPSPRPGGLHHYDSQSLPAPHGVTPSASTPHLSHLRQSSSIGFGGHHHDEHPHYPTTAAAYDVFEEIGSGAFATVYHAAVHDTGEQVAIKVIDLDQFNTNWDEIRREILIMSLVHHPNVVRILTSFVEEQDLWIVMPLLEAGSCAHIMKTLFPSGLKDEALLATILREVLQGLLYFHKDGRLHRDLKAGNVIISAHGEVQLADFGVAGTLMENGDRKKARRTFTGTPCWMAPEVMEHNENGYDEKADIWSFGITAMELAYGRAPYAKFPPMKVMVLTLQEEPPTCEIYKDHSYEFSSHFHSMIEKCLRKQPSKRPSVKKLLEHKFFKAAKDRAYIQEKIVKKMPLTKAPPPNTKLLNLCALRHPSTLNGGGGEPGGVDAEKGRPVSVGSWVFDKSELDEMKLRCAEEKERQGAAGSRSQSLQTSYAGDEDTPKGGARQAGAPAARNSNLLSVPGAGAPHARTPSLQQSSAEDDDDEHHSEEDSHALPDFSDPDPDAAHLAMQRINLDAPQQRFARSTTPQQSPELHFPHPPAHAAASSSTSPAGAASALSPQHSSPAQALSPHSEHQEGRFHVSEDAEDDDEAQVHEPYMHGEGQHESHPQSYYAHGRPGFRGDAGIAHAFEEQQHEQNNSASTSGQGQHQSGTFDGEAPAFHNDAYDATGDDDENVQAHGDEHGHQQHVGRFTCVSDDEEQ